MKKMIILFSIIIFVFSPTDCTKNPLNGNCINNYFPFHISNSWTYGDMTFEITGTRKINGNEYYMITKAQESIIHFFSDTMYYRKNEDGHVYSYSKDEDTESLQYYFSDTDTSWALGYWSGMKGIAHMSKTDETIHIPTGNFQGNYSDCYKIIHTYSNGGTPVTYVAYLSDGIGIINISHIGYTSHYLTKAQLNCN